MRFVAAWLVLGFGCSERVTPAEPLVIWRSLDARGEAIPVLDANAVYNLEQETHVVSAVRKTDGVLIWRRTLPVTTPDNDGYGLTLAGGRLVVGDLDVFGIDPATGVIQWTFVPSVGKNPGFSALTSVGDVVYAGSTTGHVYAIDAKTGAEKWAKSFNASPTQVFYPKVVDGIIYAGFTYRPAGAPPAGGAVAIDTTGMVLWKATLPVPDATQGGAVTSGVVVNEADVLVGDDNGVSILNRSTGAFRVAIGSAFFNETTRADHRPFSNASVILIGTGTGKLVAVNPDSYTKVWEKSGLGAVRSISSDSDHAFVSAFGPFQVFRLNDGSTVWSVGPATGFPSESFLAAPAIDGDRIFLPGSASVYAFRKP